MAAMDNYFLAVRSKHTRLDDQLKRILIDAACINPDRTMTLKEIRTRYTEATEKHFPVKRGTLVQMSYLLSIPFICCYSNKNGTPRFYAIIKDEDQ